MYVGSATYEPTTKATCKIETRQRTTVAHAYIQSGRNGCFVYIKRTAQRDSVFQ